MLERKQYAKPPLLEVFCEIVFEPVGGQEWDGLLLAGFYDRLGRQRFPRKKGLNTVGVALELGGADETKVDRLGPPTSRLQFLTGDGNRIVQVGENLLAVNQLPPYYGWEKFEKDALDALALYLDVWKPRRVRRAGLHYVDRIEIPGETIHLPDWFNLFPVLPTSFQDRPVSNLTMAFEVVGKREGDLLSIQFLQQPSANPELTPIHLQWNYAATRGLEATEAAVRDWLSLAHEATGTAFRSALTAKCETLFE